VNARWLVARRVVLALLSVYLVFTASFAFVALTPDPNIGSVQFFAAGECQGSPDARTECIEEKIEAYRQANNLDDPVGERYVRWLTAMVTLDWGVSVRTGLPVVGTIAARMPYTLVYVVPSMLLSAAGGLGVGAYLALNPEGHRDAVGTAATYLGYGVPNFWIAAVLLAVAGKTYALPGSFILHWDPQLSPGAGPLAPGTLVRMALPVAVLSTTLFASQLRYGRSEILEHAGSELVKMVRAKGVDDRGVARHIYRMTAPLLVSLFVVDLFSVIVVNMFVIEYVFELPGLGDLTLTAIKGRDMPLLLGTTMVIAILGIAGNLVKDLTTLALDPRVRDGDR
jgi:peptide/nickel transport system permease protein